MQDDKKKTGKTLLIVCLIVLIVIFLLTSIWLLFFRKSDEYLIPDYAPYELESNAQVIDGNDTAPKLESPDGGGAVSLTYSKTVRVSLSEKTLSLLIGNPNKSDQDIVFQVVIKDTVIAQSGRLIPGHQVQKMNLNTDVTKQLEEGGYDGKIIIYYYDRQTGEKAMLNTEIPVTLIVDN